MDDDTRNDIVVKIDQITDSKWNEELKQFSDATIYQTNAYGVERWYAEKQSHVVVKNAGRTVAMAQIRIIRLPLINIGAAYVGWGPVWRLRGKDDGINNLRAIVDVLRDEYVRRRGLYLRVFPNEFNMGDNVEAVRTVYVQAGFHWSKRLMRTILLDLTPSLDTLRMNMNRKWRQVLGYAGKEGLEIVEGSDVKYLEAGLKIYREMHERKQFAEFADIESLPTIQNKLPESSKMRILLCSYEGSPVAVLAWSAIGDTGIPMLAATSLVGRDKRASYLLWWKMIEWLKEHGYTTLDLGGIDPERNPGNYLFKSRLAAKTGIDTTYLGQFDLCTNWMSNVVIRTADWARDKYREVLVNIEKKKKVSENDD